MLPRAQFGQIASSYDQLNDAGIGVYVIYRSRNLQSGFRTAIGDLMKGQATMFTNRPQFNLGQRRSSFRKMLVDLETMKIIAVDPARGRALSVQDMIQRCEQLGDGQGEN